MIAEVILPSLATDPAESRETDQRPTCAGSETTGSRPPGVLIVDDDLAVRTLLNLVLREHGFAVWQTADGCKALKAYQGHRDDIDLVLLDVRMPGLDGPQTLAALHQLNPQLRCCFMTGDWGRYSEEELMERGAERIIYKPFRLDQVAQLLHKLISAASPPASPPDPASAGGP
jgi:CheY-like chemotaxis protein